MTSDGPCWEPSCDIKALNVRARMLRITRRFFEERDVLEVQMPVLSRHAVTDPAIECIRTRDGRFLQPSPEYHMKRLLAAGAPSIFSIGPVFRADEAGRWHNTEFTMLEWYRIGFGADDLMRELAALIDALIGPSDYERRTFAGLIALDINHATTDELDLAIADAVARLRDKRVFVTGYPARQAALARISKGVADRFELVINGIEVANGYHELTDVEELARRLTADNLARCERDRPVRDIDRAFLAAHARGLPDCAGVAVGFDRLVALKVGARAVADVMPFPDDRA
ncbi:MAG: elongation factor P lysine(34) lysyltransferase [Gammaproteobacteria bacterium]|nr:elongation factor P lysine(34) lysyltransferase [Gammaproteobacteria bacterium]